jgi:hypothetical protein
MMRIVFDEEISSQRPCQSFGTKTGMWNIICKVAERKLGRMVETAYPA